MAAAFLAGIKVQQFIYTDQCLDMGGGMNPGNHPVCVVDAAAHPGVDLM